MNIYPEAPGEIPQHCPGLSLCLFPSPVPALHLRLCLSTQKLPAYTTSQVTALSGFQLAPALPRVYLTSQKPNSNRGGCFQRFTCCTVYMKSLVVKRSLGGLCLTPWPLHAKQCQVNIASDYRLCMWHESISIKSLDSRVNIVGCWFNLCWVKELMSES